MYCPRLDHYVKLNYDGKIRKCGHMAKPIPGFDTIVDLQNTEWLTKVRGEMAKDQWPAECIRCQQSEKIKGESLRTHSIKRHKILNPLRNDYLIVGGVLDNICNSACQSCKPEISTKIGSLMFGKDYPRSDNYKIFKSLPQERIVELDISGGEPTASKNYKKVLRDLPDTVKIVRMNTNGSKIIKEIEDVLKRNIMVIVTLSFDGIGNVHDYIRWPIKWDKYKKTVNAYKQLQKKYKLLRLDMWTTVMCFNVETLPDIIKFAKDMDIPHDWGFLDFPMVLNVKYKNQFTIRAKHVSPNEIAVDEDNTKQLTAFIKQQDGFRGISVYDYYLNLGPK